MRSNRLSIIAAILLAAAATWLRFPFTLFNTLSHFDEPIVAHAAERAARLGSFSADWEVLPLKRFARPTYQFSPYTLLNEFVAFACRATLGSPKEMRNYIYLARLVSMTCGGLAVLAAYFAYRSWFADATGALVAESFLAVAFLHVQDSCYARVESTLSLSILLCFIAAGRAVRPNSNLHSLLAMGFLAGFTVAVKYNAAPILLLLIAPFFPWNGLFGRRDFLKRASACTSAAVAGFVVATPEMLVDPAPLWQGALWELRHYATGDGPFTAIDAWDNNVGYWVDYFARLGCGWLPTVLAIAFPIVALWKRERMRLLLTVYLFATAVLLCLVRVRFERNGELILGVACIAAAKTLIDLAAAWRRRWSFAAAGCLVGLLMTLHLRQEALALMRLRVCQLQVTMPARRLPAWVHRTAIRRQDVARPIPRNWRAFGALVLDGYTDPYSVRAIPKWKKVFQECDIVFFGSAWLDCGYPFCTVESYHGPPYMIVAKPRRAGPMPALAESERLNEKAFADPEPE